MCTVTHLFRKLRIIELLWKEAIKLSRKEIFGGKQLNYQLVGAVGSSVGSG